MHVNTMYISVLICKVLHCVAIKIRCEKPCIFDFLVFLSCGILVPCWILFLCRKDKGHGKGKKSIFS